MFLNNWLRNVFRKWRKHRAIRSYVYKLPGLLAKRYGHKRWYTPAQIRRTAEDCGLDTDYLCYAYATYVEEADFQALHAESGQVCSYDAMRGEIAHDYFHDHSDFTTQDLFEHYDTVHSQHGH